MVGSHQGIGLTREYALCFVFIHFQFQFIFKVFVQALTPLVGRDLVWVFVGLGFLMSAVCQHLLCETELALDS